AETRVAVLDVEDRVVERLFLRELDVELDVRVRTSREKEEAERVGACTLSAGGFVDLVHDLVDGDEVSRALAALDRLAPLRDEDELIQERLEPIRREAQRGQRVSYSRDVSVVIGAEHGDEAVV